MPLVDKVQQRVEVGRVARTGPDPTQGVYAISVAAELVGSGVQNLRAYEAYGLVRPQRSSGGTRRYSQRDVQRLREIAQLLSAGLNLAGIALVLELREDNDRLRAALRKARRPRPPTIQG